MIRIGSTEWHPGDVFQPTILTIAGTWNFQGDLPIGMANYIFIAPNAELKIGTNGTVIGSHNKIICYDSIVIKDNVRISWENQIIDSSMHYVCKNGKVSPLTKPIIIENNVWIGNRSTISRGSVIPDYSIIASGAYVASDLTKYGTNCMFTGVPAQCKATNIERIFDIEREKELDKQFNYSRIKL